MEVTPAVAAVAIYTGLLMFVLIWIGIRVVQVRAKVKVRIGDGGNIELIRAMRGNANFVENVPLALVLIALLEMQNQIIAHRSSTKKGDLDKVDWQKFYEAVKEFL